MAKRVTRLKTFGKHCCRYLYLYESLVQNMRKYMVFEIHIHILFNDDFSLTYII
jgi:hypothetical protein